MLSLSIIIPAYNEERRLPASLDAILAWIGGVSLSFFEILVIDDGSQDGTATLVERYHDRHPEVGIRRNPGNRGKGYSIRHGMTEGRGEWLLFTDADLSSPIEELPKLLEAVKRHEALVAIGSRAVDRSLVSVRQSWFREYSGRFFNLAMRAVTGLPFRDTQCGFKLYHREAARQIFPRQRLDGFSFDVEDLMIARTLGIRTIEVPVRWANVAGTKVSALSGVLSFSDLLRIRWNQLCGRYR